MTQTLKPGQRVRLNPGCGFPDQVTEREVHDGVVERVDGNDVYVTLEISGKVECHRFHSEMTIQPDTPVKPIPISAAKRIADDYGYHQVVIMARVTGEVEGSDEHITTYGINVQHCRVAAIMGDKLKEIAQWSGVDETTQRIADLEARIAEQGEEIESLCHAKFLRDNPA